MAAGGMTYVSANPFCLFRIRRLTRGEGVGNGVDTRPRSGLRPNQ